MHASITNLKETLIVLRAHTVSAATHRINTHSLSRAHLATALAAARRLLVRRVGLPLHARRRDVDGAVVVEPACRSTPNIADQTAMSQLHAARMCARHTNTLRTETLSTARRR
jgi:hypothetical protein